jgi:hypothetical protein
MWLLKYLQMFRSLLDVFMIFLSSEIYMMAKGWKGGCWIFGAE